jgi:hypothetical protein
MEDGVASQPEESAFERLMFRRLPLWLIVLSWLAGALAMLAFGMLVRSGVRWGAAASAPARAAAAIASAPADLHRLFAARKPWQSVAGEPVVPAGFSAASAFRDDGYLLLSRYDPDRRRNLVELRRAADGVVLRTFAPDIAAINRRSRLQTPFLDLARDKGAERYRMTHPLLTPDGGLIFQDMTPLVKVDACGRIVWTIDEVFHHSVELDRSGTLWTIMTLPKSSLPHVSPTFHEDAVVRVDPGSGRIIGWVSVADILNRNGLTYLWRGRPYDDDPFHLNEVQPVPGDGAYWRAQDVFLSFRNMSLVLLYRPSTGRVMWFRHGPWSLQHDVSVLDDHRIAVFDNNAGSGAAAGDGDGRIGEADFVETHNRLLVYDFRDDTISSPYDAIFSDRRIHTVTEGRGGVLANGDLFVEETALGRVMRVARDGQVRWSYISAGPDGTRYMLGWSRYLTDPASRAAVASAMGTTCP